MPAGQWRGELLLAGHIPVSLIVPVLENQTNSVRTNLVNWQYAQAAESARESFARKEYDHALQAVTAALKIHPNDPEVVAFQKEITVARHLQRALAVLEKADYSSGRRGAGGGVFG